MYIQHTRLCVCVRETVWGMLIHKGEGGCANRFVKGNNAFLFFIEQVLALEFFNGNKVNGSVHNYRECKCYH